MKFKIATLGCRNNQYESAEVRASFEKEGYQPVSRDGQADICVINTCSVTEKSNYRCRQLIRKTIDSNPKSLVVVVGCYPQLDPEAIKSLPGVDLILGNEEKLDIIKFLKDFNILDNGNVNKKKQLEQKLQEDQNSIPHSIPLAPLLKRERAPMVVVGKLDEDTIFRSEEVSHFAGKTKAFLKIQTGCNFKCSFCVITLARGRSRSAAPKKVLHQFKKLLENGFKEITLTGIHLGSYGKDLTPSTNVNELLKALINIKGNFRIRLSSLGPIDINDELIDLIAGSSKICNHLHISLQSGSDKILRLMKRNYRMEFFYRLSDKITSKVPGIGFGADIIAGFPGEGDKEFEESLKVVEEIPFSYLHVFNFSRRNNTAAYNLPEQVPHGVRKKRVSILKELSKQKSLAYSKSFLSNKLMGKNPDVLIEQDRDPSTGLLKGYTGNYLPVLLSGKDDLMNQIVNVRLSHLEKDRLYAITL